MIKIREVTPSDILKLDELWQKYWSDTSLPNRNNKVIDGIAYDDASNRIIGYGQVKIFAEAQLFLDPTTPKRDRVKALKLLMHDAEMATHQSGIESLYAFIKDPDFAVLIARRYGFHRVIEPGELLLKTGV